MTRRRFMSLQVSQNSVLIDFVAFTSVIFDTGNHLRSIEQARI